MTFWNLKDLPLDLFRPGIFSKAELGENLIMAVMEIEAGKEDPGHSHPHDQCGVVLDGRVEMYIGDERKILNPFESYFIPAGIMHGWKIFEKNVRLLDVSLKSS